MPPSPIRVCFSLDRGYIPPTLVAIYSLIETSQHDLEINILGVDFEAADWGDFERVITCRRDIAVTLRKFPLASKDFKPDVAQNLAMLSILLLPKLMQGRVIYLDGDVLVTCDLAELFHRDMGGCPIGVCKAVKNLVRLDVAKNTFIKMVPPLRHRADRTLKRLAQTIGEHNPEDYINTGAVLFDLDAITSDATTLEKVTDLGAAAAFKWPDQTHLFKVFNGNIDFLDLKWNTYRGNEFWGRFLLSPAFRKALDASRRDAAIIHFVGPRKPWKPQGRLPFPGSRWFKVWQDKAKALSLQM
jgi:lipopolysaccharide biosynthesis glycosyltransferase